MPTCRDGYPLINELNKHVLRYEMHLDQLRNANEHYALERANLVAQGTRCTYVIESVQSLQSEGPRSSENSVMVQIA